MPIRQSVPKLKAVIDWICKNSIFQHLENTKMKKGYSIQAIIVAISLTGLIGAMTAYSPSAFAQFPPVRTKKNVDSCAYRKPVGPPVCIGKTYRPVCFRPCMGSCLE